MFNSSLIYELAVLKQYVEPLLFGVDKSAPEYAEAKRLLKFFDYFVGIGSESVPTNSPAAGVYRRRMLSDIEWRTIDI